MDPSFTFSTPQALRGSSRHDVKENQSPSPGEHDTPSSKQAHPPSVRTDSALRMKRWMEATTSDGVCINGDSGFSPLRSLAGAVDNTTAKGSNIAGATLQCSPIEKEEHFKKWLSATAEIQFTPLKGLDVACLTPGPAGTPMPSNAEPSEENPQEGTSLGDVLLAAVRYEQGMQARVLPQTPNTRMMPEHSQDRRAQQRHATDAAMLTPGSMYLPTESETMTERTDDMSGTPLTQATPWTKRSACSTSMSVAYSEISKAVSRMQLRELHAGAAAPHAAGARPMLTPGGATAMDMSPLLIGAGGMQAPAMHNGILAMTAIRPNHAPALLLATPPKSPVEQVLDLMAAEDEAEQEEQVQPQQLLFEDKAPAAAAWNEDSEDEVWPEELEMMTPIAGPASDVYWRAASGTTPLSELLAMMATPGGAAEVAADSS